MPQVIDKVPVARNLENIREVRHCPGCGDPVIKVPVLQCANCGHKVGLRAFCYKRSRGYIAECIDLNLVSQGKTKEEAIGALQEAMFSYLAVVFDGGPTRKLVPRLSPLANRIHYHLHRLYCRIASFFGNRHHKHLLPLGPDQNNQTLCCC